MPCQDFENSLDSYDELSNSERKVLDEHMSACAGCREYRETLKQLDVWLAREYATVEASALFQERLRSRVMSGSRTSKLSILPEIFDFIGWTSIVFIASGSIWRMAGVEKIWRSFPGFDVPVLFYTSILMLLALIGIGVKVHSELES